MPWNSPGGNKDDDPWGQQSNNQGPPDLDEVFRNLTKRFGGILVQAHQEVLRNRNQVDHISGW